MQNPIQTYGVKYLGSKKTLLPHIGQVIQDLNATTAIDVFSGTTRVAQYLKQLGIRTDTSDLSWATTAYANTYVHGLGVEDSGELKYLNSLEGHPGWLSENYTGDFMSTEERGDGRCFQLKNAMKADRARDWVENMYGLGSEFYHGPTYYGYITSIIRALDAVDNTVGVQQAYLKSWCKRSYNDITFLPIPKLQGPTGFHYEGDALTNDYRDADVAYIDPPYSPHAYSTYYHIWDSIVRWDKPETGLKARRRLDRVSGSQDYDGAMSSPWNSPRTALGAFAELFDRLPVKHMLVSYSDESIVPRGELIGLASQFGAVKVIEVDYKRNIMSQIGNATKHAAPEAGQKNKELLILISR